MKLCVVLSVMAVALIPLSRAGLWKTISKYTLSTVNDQCDDRKEICLPNVALKTEDLTNVENKIDKGEWMKHCTGTTFFNSIVPAPIGKAARFLLSYIPLIGHVDEYEPIVKRVNGKLFEFESAYNSDPDNGYVESMYKRAKSVFEESALQLAAIYRKTPSDENRDEIDRICSNMYTGLTYIEAGVHIQPWWKKAAIGFGISFAGYKAYQYLTEN